MTSLEGTFFGTELRARLGEGGVVVVRAMIGIWLNIGKGEERKDKDAEKVCRVPLYALNHLQHL